jgi:hypothetical protein
VRDYVSIITLEDVLMIEIRMDVPPDAPDEVKQLITGIKNMVVPTPAKEELEAILALEPGPEQDKLYNETFKRQYSKAIKLLKAEIEALHSASCQDCSQHGSN